MVLCTAKIVHKISFVIIRIAVLQDRHQKYMCLLSVTPCGCGKALPIILSQSSADGFLPVGFGSESSVTLCYTLCHAHCIPWLPDPAVAFDYMNSLSWIGWQRRPPKGTTSLLCGEVKNAVLLLWKPPLSLPMTLAHEWSLVFILWLCWEYQCEADQTWRESLHPLSELVK